MAGLFKCVSVCVGCMCVFKCISTLTEHLLYFVLGLFPPIISMCHHLQQPHSKVLNKWFLEWKDYETFKKILLEYSWVTVLC